MSRFYLFLCALCALLSSCSREDELPDSGASSPSFADKYSSVVSVVDGVLHVDSCELGREFIAVLANVPTAERMAWEKSVGFHSLQSVIDSLCENSHSASVALSNVRPDLFEVCEDDSSSTILPVSVAMIANTNGFYHIGPYRYVVRNGSVAVFEGASDIPVNEINYNRENLKAISVTPGVITCLKEHSRNAHYWVDVQIKLEKTDIARFERYEAVLSTKSSYKKFKRWYDHRATMLIEYYVVSMKDEKDENACWSDSTKMKCFFEKMVNHRYVLTLADVTPGDIRSAYIYSAKCHVQNSDGFDVYIKHNCKE